MGILQHFEQCKTLLDYLKTLPNHVVDDLFGYPAACLAIFRELPKLAQNYVLRILYVEQAIPQAVISTWVSQAHIKEHTQAAETITSLRVWKEVTVQGGLPGWMLDHKFRHNLKVALLGGGKEWTKSLNLEPDSKPKTVKDLDAYALDRWEALLHFLTQRHQKSDSVSRDAILTLTHAGLMEQDESNSHPSITNEGFQFLLLDTASQVWYFIVKYLETVEAKGLTIAECLAFLFSLSFATLGRDYGTVDDRMQIFLQHLREFGLIYQRTRKAGRFYPTRLALNLASKNNKISLDTDKYKTGFLVVETNYRVYAYTDSELQLALVGLFTEFLFRFPNLVVGVITRDSIRQALRSGISAEQIISFLKMHAHSEMIKATKNVNNPLPPTIVDQIRLWEMERNRLTFTESVLYNQFLSQRDYEVVRDYAQDIGVLIHGSDQKRTVVVKVSGHEDVKKFWKRHSKGN